MSDQNTINEILSKLGGLTAEVKNLVIVSDRMDTKIEEMKNVLGARVHGVNTEITVLKAGFTHIVDRIDKIEPVVDDLADAHKRNEGAMAVGKFIWLFAVSAITATITASITVLAQHVFGIPIH